MSGNEKMTRAEAIKLVKSDGLYSQEVIDALEDKPVISKERIEEILVEYGVAFTDSLADRLVREFEVERESSGDLISRQTVLGIIEKEQFKGDAIAEIEKLPSVTPQEPTDTWSIKDVADTFKKHGLIVEQEPKTGHCKDCKHFREIPYHIDICIQHTELCPKGDWYCADFEPQESDNCN